MFRIKFLAAFEIQGFVNALIHIVSKRQIFITFSNYTLGSVKYLIL